MAKDKRNLQVFGYGLGLIAALFGIVGWVKHGIGLAVLVLLICSVVFMAVTYFDLHSLKPGYLAWMKLAHLIGATMTTVILSVIFFLIFIPVGFLLKIMGRDHLQRDFSRKSLTYWEKRERAAFQQQRYHQQF